jgi:hypothetical protein
MVSEGEAAFGEAMAGANITENTTQDSRAVLLKSFKNMS